MAQIFGAIKQLFVGEILTKECHEKKDNFCCSENST